LQGQTRNKSATAIVALLRQRSSEACLWTHFDDIVKSTRHNS